MLNREDWRMIREMREKGCYHPSRRIIEIESSCRLITGWRVDQPMGRHGREARWPD